MADRTITADEYRAMRKAMGMTQAELAKRVGVNSNTVARRERGELPIDVEASIAIEALAFAEGVR